MLEWLQCALTATQTYSSHISTALYETYVASQEESECVYILLILQTCLQLVNKIYEIFSAITMIYWEYSVDHLHNLYHHNTSRCKQNADKKKKGLEEGRIRCDRRRKREHYDTTTLNLHNIIFTILYDLMYLWKP